MFYRLPCSLVLWQSSVVVSVSVGSPDLFHIVLRYVNQASVEVLGRVVVLEGDWSYYCANCEFMRTGSVLSGSAGDWWFVLVGVASANLLTALDCYSPSPSSSITSSSWKLTFLSSPPLFSMFLRCGSLFFCSFLT